MEKCLQERVFGWLCRNDGFHLKEIERQCRELIKDAPQGKLVNRFVLSVNLIDLIDFDAHLGNIALHETLKLVTLFQEVCYTTVTTLQWIPSITSAAQILVILRFSSIPRLPEYSSNERRGLMNSTRIHTGMFSIEGVVCAMAGVTQYTQSARFYCPISTCPGASRCSYIRVHLAGRSEALTTGKIFNCKYCRSTLQEDATCRNLSEKSIIHVISLHSLSAKTWINEQQARYQAVPVYLRDELTKEVQLGGLYRFTLLHFVETGDDDTTNEISSTAPVFEVNSIEQINGTLTIEKQLSGLPNSIRMLLEDRKDSPWSFAASLAYCFGVSIVHPSSLLHLKMSVLLSLVLVVSKSAANIVTKLDILALGQDSLTIQRLLMYSASFAPRLLMYSTVSDLFTTVSRDPSGTGTYIVNAGCLLLANNGICMISNVNAMKKDSKERLRRVMENRIETVEIPKKYTDCAQHLNMPLESSVWTCYESQDTTIKVNGAESWDQLNQKDSTQSLGATTQALVNRFSLVVSVNDYDVSLTSDVVLKRAMDGYNEEQQSFIPDDDIQQFLQFVSQRPVSFGESPQKLIQSFYLAGRRARCLQGDFPLSSLQTVTSLSAAHAKLSLRDQVIDEDVVAAVQMFDNSIRVSHGYSLFGLQQDYLNSESILSVKHDLKMREFQRMLYNFCSNHKFHGSFIHED